jgi:NADPH2:quinone reductase
MKAARLHSFGSEVSIDEVEEPQPEGDDVVVDVRFAAVNPLDLWVSEGSVAGGSQPLPMALGTEGVAEYEGRLVMVGGFGLGVARDGLFRERADVPLAALTDVPDGVEEAQAAGAGVVGITAKRVFEVGGLSEGEKVVVLGASGGVGSVAIQVGKLLGAHVTAVTSSEEKRADLEQLGADEVVVSAVDALPEAIDEPVDLVLNPLAGTSIDPVSAILRVGGRQVLLGRSAGDRAEFSAGGLYRKGLSVIGYGGLTETPEQKDAARAWILDRMVEGKLRIPISDELPLGDAAEALDRVRHGRVVGKIVLRTSG